MAIREEEYAVLAFAMESTVSDLLARHDYLSPPRVYLLRGEPDLGEGRNDLIYWWHEAVEKFSHLGNEARIDLLKRSEEREVGFERRKFRELGLEIGGLSHNSIPKVAKWSFTLSRAGLDRENRQAVAHVWAEPECDSRLGAGFVVVAGWSDAVGTLELLERVPTGRAR